MSKEWGASGASIRAVKTQKRGPFTSGPLELLNTTQVQRQKRAHNTLFMWLAVYTGVALHNPTGPGQVHVAQVPALYTAISLHINGAYFDIPAFDLHGFGQNIGIAEGESTAASLFIHLDHEDPGIGLL